MKTIGYTILLLIFCLACKKQAPQRHAPDPATRISTTTESYELVKTGVDPAAVLVLFGGYPETIEDIKREFKIQEIAQKHKVAVLYMNYSQKLWLEAEEKQDLADQLNQIFTHHELDNSAVFFGGFSSGGNVALLISAYLAEESSYMTPKGVFAVDSPVDLAALYASSKKNIERDYSSASVQESKFILQLLESQLGTPSDQLAAYENRAVYTSVTDNMEQLRPLQDVNIRLYAEPDTAWWKENRGVDLEQMNAYYLDRMSQLLKSSGFKNVEYITSQNKGYRANGERHPHSWSIVDKRDLIKWIISGRKE